MLEQSKAARRRFYNGNFHNRYFCGDGIDIGGRPDPFSQYIGVFPLVKSVKIWDLEDGDAQFMRGCEDETYDFVVSSHCLEHMCNVEEALFNWIRIIKKGGYLIITVPDEDMYEQQQWPSVYNPDHRWTFTIYKQKSWSQKSINILDLLKRFAGVVEIEKVEKISEFYNHNVKHKDQTFHVNIESAIEFILRKKSESVEIEVQKNREYIELKAAKGFSSQFSEAFNKISKLSKKNAKYVVYGYGSMGQVIDKLLGEQVVAFVDKKRIFNDNAILKRENIYMPDAIKDMLYDYVIISVLGREEEIAEELIKTYGVKKEKIITFEI